jgi:hypothetical protein
MALEAIKYNIFLSLHVFIFLHSFIFENENSPVGFSMWKLEIKTIFLKEWCFKHCPNTSMKYIRLEWQAGIRCKCSESTNIFDTTNI